MYLAETVFPAPLLLLRGDEANQLNPSAWPRTDKRNIPLSANDNRLVSSRFSSSSHHATVRILGDSEQVRFELALSPSGVGLDDGGRVDGEGGERIDGDEDDSGISVNLAQRVAVKDGVED